MRTAKQLQEDINAILKKLGDMKATCENENRDHSEEELEVATNYLDEIDKLEKLLAHELRARKTVDRLKEPEVKPDRTPIDTKKDVGDRRDFFASEGEFYQAVVNAGRPGGRVDPRLSTRAASGLSESVPSDGGFLVESGMASEMLRNMWENGAVISRVNRATLTGNLTGMKYNGFDETSRADGSRQGGIRAYWAAEAAAKTASKPAFRQIELTLHKLIGLCYATDELLMDAGALAQEIRNGFQNEFDFKITNAIINGTGAGQPLGILNSGCLVSVTAEAGQAADTIVYQNVLKMWSRLKADSRPNAVWLINQNCEPQLHQMSLVVGTGGSAVYLPQGGASTAPYATLFGRPVIPIEQCPVLGDAGDIILADFSHYRMIDKGGMQGDVSIHVRFVYDESVFRFVYRLDGQPELASAITPFTAGATTATDTLSHFVALESR